MRFVWFWTFWHWSNESFRAGVLLRGPLEGVGGHWDEWHRHEASAEDRRAIERIGRSESAQREFMAWLFRRWAKVAGGPGTSVNSRFVLGQLARQSPFDHWPALAKYRARYGAGGVSALVLAEDSPGAPSDVRQLEALALATDAAGGAQIVPEGFYAGAKELEAPSAATASLLSGKGLLAFLALWVACGRRPYPRWLRVGLRLGWLATGALILLLLTGPDPGDGLVPMAGLLAGLWGGLLVTAVGVAGLQCLRAWRAGKSWQASLDRSQIRLRMEGGLTLKGASAGLPFCLNSLLALYCASPAPARRSWLWRGFFRNLRAQSTAWSATGVVTATGWLKPVVLEPKLRACLQHERIQHILTPRQRDATCAIVPPAAEPALPARTAVRPTPSPGITTRLGFAAEKPVLQTHPCRHIAQAVMAIGELSSRWQLAVNIFAVIVSAVLFAALGDLRAILFPPAPPARVQPASPSPYYVWVSLDTSRPRYFEAVLESRFWANRRVGVARYTGANASIRAEIPLRRLARSTTSDANEGLVWVERRRWFLAREFLPGERVGRYSLPYLTRLGHE